MSEVHPTVPLSTVYISLPTPLQYLPPYNTNASVLVLQSLPLTTFLYSFSLPTVSSFLLYLPISTVPLFLLYTYLHSAFLQPIDAHWKKMLKLWPFCKLLTRVFRSGLTGLSVTLLLFMPAHKILSSEEGVERVFQTTGSCLLSELCVCVLGALPSPTSPTSPAVRASQFRVELVFF